MVSNDCYLITAKLDAIGQGCPTRGPQGCFKWLAT